MDESLASVRPRHLLSGKLTYGCCAGPMIRSGSEQRFVCSWRRERGPAACDNGRGVKGADIADRVRAALRDRLLIDQVADGVLSGPAIKDRLATLETQRATLEAELAHEEAPSPVACTLGSPDTIAASSATYPRRCIGATVKRPQRLGIWCAG
nr:zinc ribbon domain-containing protein [Enterobacter roggenkampii]